MKVCNVFLPGESHRQLNRSVLIISMVLLGSAWVQGQTSLVAPAPVVPSVPITVAPAARPSATDDAIAIEILRAFYYDPRVPSAFTHVDVANGVATLSGSVPTNQARQAADDLAARTPGVSRVIDKLEIAPLEPAHPDEEIYRNVRHVLGADPQVNRYLFQVGVVHGRVYLAGSVDTVYARAKAANLAAEVPGVTGVENALDVPRGGGYPDKTLCRSDDQLRRDIAQRLAASDMVDYEGINVYVHDGTATLTGLVANDAERNAAVHNAYAAGARFVRDGLTLLPLEPVAQAPVISPTP